MKAKYAGMGLVVVVLVAVGWCIAQPPLASRAERGRAKGKPARYQVIGAGLITAVLVDNETGKTWALTPGNMLDGPRGFGGEDMEFAWTPITKFDDLESYRRWVKVQQENRLKMQRERYKDRDKYYDKASTAPKSEPPAKKADKRDGPKVEKKKDK